MVLLWITISLSNSDVKFLSKVSRFDSQTLVDYYFSCKMTGNFIHWRVYNDDLNGFLINDVGKVFVNSRNNFNYMTTLLYSSCESICTLDSMLMITYPTDRDPDFIVVHCTTDTSTNSINTSVVSPARYRVAYFRIPNQYMKLEYVLNSPIVKNINTHIFICKTQSTVQRIDFGENSVYFNENDRIGWNRTVYLTSGKEVYAQAVLLDRTTDTLTTSLIVANNSDIFVKCYLNGTMAVSLSTAPQIIETAPEHHDSSSSATPPHSISEHQNNSGSSPHNMEVSTMETKNNSKLTWYNAIIIHIFHYLCMIETGTTTYEIVGSILSVVMVVALVLISVCCYCYHCHMKK